ncbi:YitT family protein [Rhizobiaceae bacterium n13]|uniref:YitT family protein n=1 Tax=Ferirhizobium litorale TaxID=2927786 RepID=A0AAE3QCN0_9HYPH|nr:YitT family protein [Fererhizobium litorale]MDI7862285.1 YitT family protein [Fererhizobium litorale]MDI7922441.1 YitT family protein [Fererhizobium litorale]
MASSLAIIRSTSDRHSLLEDAQAIITGSMLVTLGIALLQSAGLLTGGTPGLAFLIHYVTGASFGLCFFLLNVPFYYFALRRLGLLFTFKTFCAVGLTSLLSGILPRTIDFANVDPLVGAMFGGIVIGAGMLALFRHRASLGGVGILALYLQDRFGWRAGLVQLGFDLAIVACSFFIASPWIVACSIVGAALLNLTLAVNHRKDRYIAA